LKITIFGLTLSSSWGNGHATPYRAILRALKRLRHEVTFYEKDVDYYRRHRDLSSADYAKLVLYPDWASVRQHAMEEAAASDAVIVGSYCPEGARIADEVLGLDRPVRIFYDLDTPITLAGLSSHGVEYLRRDQMPEFDLYLSFTGGRILHDLESHYGVRRAAAIYGCVDPDTYHRVEAKPEFECDLNYMGTYAADRQHKLDAVFLEPARRMANRTFVLAGSLYPREWQWPENVRRFEHVATKEHPAMYSSCRATLNITRDGMARSGYCPSGRFFEAAACGAPIFTDWFDGLDTFFAPGEEIVIVQTADDVIAALRMDEHERRKLAQHARERTLSEHTGDNRARELVRLIYEARASARVPYANAGAAGEQIVRAGAEHNATQNEEVA
jgi:spore maturation protein CgeB